MSSKIEERIEEIKKEIDKMKINKATESHYGYLKSRLSQLESELLERASQSKGAHYGFSIKKQGDATVILLGFPSVGKSTLLNGITNKKSKVAAYDFTTLEAIPGMIKLDNTKYKGAKIQIFDLPGVIEGGAAQNKGRGREIYSVVRTGDLITIMIDVQQPEQLDIILQELYKANVRLNQKLPRIRIDKKTHGGLNITGFRSQASEEEIKSVLRTYKINNANVFLKERDLTLDQIIDYVAGNRVYIPSLIVLNKIDLLKKNQVKQLKKKIQQKHQTPVIPISADKKRGLRELKEKMVERLELIRIYLKEQGKSEADMEEPLIVKRGSTIEDVCKEIHRSFLNDFRWAEVTGKSAKFPGQKVGLDHRVQDGDIVKIVLKR